ncbi:MAG: ribokinase [bacterium]
MAVSITVVGSFVMDFIFETPKRPVKGETVIGRSFHMATGGKGANQAMQAALLGAKAWMVGRVGADMFGDMQLESLSKAGVDVSYVIRDQNNGTGVASIVLDMEGDNSIVMVPRANMACQTDDVERARNCVENSDMILLQLEIPMKVNRYAIKLAKQLDKKIILDPAPACAVEDYFYENVEIMTPNETEAAILSGVDVKDVESARKAARVMHERGARTVVVTLGDKGTLLSEGERATYFPPCRIKAVDSTAAGDAFAGALAVFLGECYPILDAVKLAGAAGALCATKLGAQPSLPSRREFDDFLHQVTPPEPVGV